MLSGGRNLRDQDWKRDIRKFALAYDYRYYFVDRNFTHPAACYTRAGKSSMIKKIK